MIKHSHQFLLICSFERLPIAHPTDLCIQLFVPKPKKNQSKMEQFHTFASTTGLSKNPSGRLPESSLLLDSLYNKHKRQHRVSEIRSYLVSFFSVLALSLLVSKRVNTSNKEEYTLNHTLYWYFHTAALTAVGGSRSIEKIRRQTTRNNYKEM